MKCLSLTYSTVNFVRSENTPGLRCSILFDFIHLRKNVYLSFQLVKKKKKNCYWVQGTADKASDTLATSFIR